jgi:hypothetical protein
MTLNSGGDYLVLRANTRPLYKSTYVFWIKWINPFQSGLYSGRLKIMRYYEKKKSNYALLSGSSCGNFKLWKSGHVQDTTKENPDKVIENSMIAYYARHTYWRRVCARAARFAILRHSTFRERKTQTAGIELRSHARLRPHIREQRHWRISY